ncbi:MAG: hypothetical protein EGQ45_01470, partial [Clostridiales bacterium]|nr:hypothetical protein [Clostridiales bacterium]
SVSEVQPTITDAGRAVMRELGIRTELDLRRADTNEVGGLTETGVLEGGRYVQCPMDGTEGTLLAANRAALPQVFSPEAAASFLVFTALYAPCVAAQAAMRQELGSRRAACAAAAGYCAAAWCTAAVVYRIAIWI